VNKEMSAKYEDMVNQAPELIKSLPWGPDFEVAVFRRPDFTALEILTFANSGAIRSSGLICLIYIDLL
jgi:dipeptidyl-peptidase-3